MTGRDYVSRVRSLNKLINSDNTVTDRAIYKELRSTNSLLIKRETNQRKLWNSPNIFTSIECIEMKPVPLSECCDYTSPCTVARSVKKIPQISEGIFGLLAQSVFSPGGRRFDYAAPERFANILKMGIRNTKKYYWIYNDFLYVSDSSIELVTLVAYFDDDFDPKEFSSCNTQESTACINPLDKEFPCPAYLDKTLIDLVNETLNKTYMRYTTDLTPDKNDTQNKK